ncbi:NADH-quinone oxidoreductase subunit J [Streptomyces zagrosensis]|uniref:NADH-quinone oxidoreductase subunit J n=1 Tax=Streptomyces zagrosensis TaxID=1042984 RepID=A0A7W9QD63_9ACTN|nr:NADH-quinone oxidoreductase subunit J [Streptomyces zagrosensis]
MTLAAGNGFLSPTGVEVAFLLVGIATLGAAIVTVTTKQLVHAALWLVVALGGLAVEYLLLTAEFIAWVQVLIYVGSVVVLLLFGLMLTKAPIGRSPDADSGNRWAALTVAVAAAATLVWVVVDAFRSTWIDLDTPLPGGKGEAGHGSTRVTGEFLFRHWVLPFEALSVLLLAALVGAIVLSRKDREGGPEDAKGRRTPGRRPPRNGGGRNTAVGAVGPGARSGRRAGTTGSAARANTATGTRTPRTTRATSDAPATRDARTPRAAAAPRDSDDVARPTRPPGPADPTSPTGDGTDEGTPREGTS